MQATTKRRLILGAKVAFSLAALVYIYHLVVARDGADTLVHRLAHVSWGWFAAAVAMQLIAVAFSAVRWQRLLVGQGIHASWRFLSGSVLIARFWGAFTPGGFTGWGGWRIYDVARHTGKTARATATIGVETILGQCAFGVVVLAGSIFGLRFIGVDGVLLVNGLFLGLVTAGLLVLARPNLLRLAARFLPAAMRPRLQTLVDAVCAYQGKSKLLVQAALLGVGTHAFNNLVYVCAARAIGAKLGIGEVFFGASLTIFAALLPASINGIGLREGTAVALYTRLGVPAAVALLIPVLSFAAEMLVSSVGGLVFMARRTGYDPHIRVDDPDREQAVYDALPPVPAERWPRIVRGLTIGLGAGLLAGMFVGLGEAVVVEISSDATPDFGVLWYGAIAYGLFCAVVGAGGGAALALSGRLMKREAFPEPVAYARLTAGIVAVVALGLGAFRIRRDLFAEQLVWKSPKGLLVMLACMAGAAVLYFVLATLLRLVTSRRPGDVMLRAWGSPAVVAVLIAAIAGVSFFTGEQADAAPRRKRAPAPAQAGNVLVIVVDTLRADHLGVYGDTHAKTPSVDAFARDAVRFDKEFSNASWTRPSFASILTSRYPSSHHTMSKSDSLPDALTTMAEAFAGGGYYTTGFVTNFNVAPFFNFQQGFDEYHYLEPSFVLGADDADAKLLLVQFFRQKIELLRERTDRVEPGSAYRDAATVDRHVFRWLDHAPRAPFFLFVAYMDPHDPYFPHPYTGSSYSRAAHQHPPASLVGRLRHLYDGEVSYWDHNFGTLIADLKRRHLYDSMTIVVTGDHGEEFQEHGGFWHGTTLYDEQVHVPLFVKLPHQQHAGMVVHHWTQSLDIMPTVLRLEGIAPPAGVQGGDLFQGHDSVFAEEALEGNVLESLRAHRGGSAIKIITANPGNPRGLAPVELYHLDEDPGEHVNLAGERSAEVQVARGELDASHTAAQRGAVARHSVDTAGNAGAAERLRALGYAGAK